MKALKIAASVVALFLSVTVGCSQTEKPVASIDAAASPYRLTTEPSDPKGVKAARASAKNDEEVNLVGRIGGDVDPWVAGQAAFMLVDSALKPCNENDDDGCTTPWDYCCDTDVLPASKAMVKVVDASGKTVAVDAKKLLGVKELQTVVVRGRAKRDDAGNLTVLASGIFVRN